MRTPPKPPTKAVLPNQLEMLTALGFGPDTVLMNDPKLFVDGRFLSSLMVELEDELGSDRAALALFQIGLLHGLREAARLNRRHDAYADSDFPAPLPETPTLMMNLWQESGGEAVFTLPISGSWPERHEATARCARLGSTSSPGCWMSAGYTTGWLSGALDSSLVVREVECAATGAPECRFEARSAADWRETDDESMSWLLAEVPFEAFRKVAVGPAIDRDAQPPAAGVDVGQFDREQAVVHIWGPVMVLPFTTIDEALGTVDMLGRDSGIGEIRAVVIDLREQNIDEGFGAAALEQILETVDSWSAQSLITGVSSASEPVVASLETSHLVLRKDLSEAIATAFQIADAQRHHV